MVRNERPTANRRKGAERSAVGRVPEGMPAAAGRPPTPRRELKIRRRHLIRPTSRRERAQLPTLPAANHIPPHPQPPNQASSRQSRHLSWRHVALRSKRTGRRERVRNTATDAFGRPGPGRSPGRSLPSFCRYRKKGPAGEAVEEMPHKITEKGMGRNETQKGTERTQPNPPIPPPQSPQTHPQPQNHLQPPGTPPPPPEPPGKQHQYPAQREQY